MNPVPNQVDVRHMFGSMMIYLYLILLVQIGHYYVLEKMKLIINNYFKLLQKERFSYM